MFSVRVERSRASQLARRKGPRATTMACMARFLGSWALYLNRPLQDQRVMRTRQVGEQPKDESSLNHGPSPLRHLRPLQGPAPPAESVGRRDQVITDGIPIALPRDEKCPARTVAPLLP